jgi:formylmethanofuran dehydrogenase subunit E
MDEIIEKIADPEMRSQIEKVASFHGYLSTGAFAGIQMLNLAKKVLCASNKDRLFVTCETYNCLPDPFQVLAGCTVGNKGLKIPGPWQDGSHSDQACVGGLHRKRRKGNVRPGKDG